LRAPLVDAPATPPRAAAVFAHPHPQYGGTMHTKVVFRAAKKDPVMEALEVWVR